MSFWEHKFNEWQVYEWEVIADNHFFVFAMLFFTFEIIRLLIKKEMTWNTAGDAVANFVTLAAHLGIVTLSAGLYLGAFYLIYPNFSLMMLPNNFWTIPICIVLADLVYYWEHRAAHRLGIGWATHTVHHSSPEFNISVAYRFGPLDGFYPWFFHFPLVLLGFHPLLVVGAEILVQAYQAILHTEAIPKLHRWIEKVFNTPSHHRVHHGSNPQYCDKNYAGIFIIWDRIFGTFEPEADKVIYGITRPLNSVNPIVVFFHGFPRLWAQLRKSRSVRDCCGYLFMPPGWEPGKINVSKSEVLRYKEQQP